MFCSDDRQRPQQAVTDIKDHDSRDIRSRTQVGESDGQRCLKAGWQEARKRVFIVFRGEDAQMMGIADGHSLRHKK